MAKRRVNFDNTGANLASVRIIPVGTRMRCREDGLIYQLGERASHSQFWMMRENPAQKGAVHVNTIMEHFEVVKDEVQR